MRLEAWAEFSGIEIANAARTSDYVRNGLAGAQASIPITGGCDCPDVDEGPYLSPGEDPAPWIDPARPESEQFLGLWASDIRIDSVIARRVNPRALGGASVGKMRPRHRIVAVTGLMLAQTAQGAAWGERWLTDILAGLIVGCAPDTMTLLLACPEPGFTAPFRTLRQVGIVDGPTFGPIGEFAECKVQEVQFQVAAGIPHLLSDAVTCLPETELVGVP